MTIERQSEGCYAITGHTVDQYLSMFRKYFQTIGDSERTRELAAIEPLLIKHGMTLLAIPSLPESDNGNKIQFLEVSIHNGERYHTKTDETRFSYHHGTTGDDTLLQRTAEYIESLIE